MSKETVHILGSGLVGSLLGLSLAKKGYQIEVFEKRPDPELKTYGAGRSINLALSHRGIQALKAAGVFEKVSESLIPMKGRLIHDEAGNLTIQPYGKEGQFIYSVSRSDLNLILIREARKAGVHFHFEQECTDIDFTNQTLKTLHEGQLNSVPYEVLFAADGAFSVLRKMMEKSGRTTCTLEEMTYGYKELTLPASNHLYAMEPDYLHIWPRKSFMLIALPNPDQTFTCTLFLPNHGTISFDKLAETQEIDTFFRSYFPDVTHLIPNYTEQFSSNPTSSLVTVKTYPWATENTLLIGDASHAIVPFYGQGMNAGFEDVRLLIEALPERSEWGALFDSFQVKRKSDADAIADLALGNFIEMRDRVADARFLAQKKLEKQLSERFPGVWTPLYSLVTFSDTPYSDCLQLGKTQQAIMDKIPDLDDPSLNLEGIIRELNESKQAAQKASR